MTWHGAGATIARMKSVNPTRFPAARENESLLNYRQRKILDLLVKGKTNGEIAERLEMTLDGAKWNVSEILTKLGLSTREEAAEYWRWRRGGSRRVGAWMRGLFTPLVGKVALGGGAAVVVGVILFGAFTTADDGEVGALEPFYLEATISGLAFSAADGRTSTATLRWWFEDIDRQRMEFYHGGLDPDDGLELAMVSDGSRVQVHARPGPFDHQSGFIVLPLQDLPGNPQFRPWQVLGVIGPPIVAMDDVSDFDEYLAASRGFGLAPRGVETVLGRSALVREWKSADGDAESTYWIDEETLFLLRTETLTSEGRRYEIAVTRLDLDAKHETGTFALDTIPDREVMPADPDYERFLDYASMSWIERGSSVPLLPEGMFAPEVDGWLVDRAFYSVGGDGDVGSVSTLRQHERMLTVRQDFRPNWSLGVGIDVPVRGATGRINSNSSGNTLVFWEDGVRVELTSPDLTHDELVAIADSLQPN